GPSGETVAPSPRAAAPLRCSSGEPRLRPKLAVRSDGATRRIPESDAGKTLTGVRSARRLRGRPSGSRTLPWGGPGAGRVPHPSPPPTKPEGPDAHSGCARKDLRWPGLAKLDQVFP